MKFTTFNTVLSSQTTTYITLFPIFPKSEREKWRLTASRASLQSVTCCSDTGPYDPLRMSVFHFDSIPTLISFLISIPEKQTTAPATFCFALCFFFE